MATNLFVSYDHDDQSQVNGFRAIKFNPNHDLDFHDHSLKDAVRDRSGTPIKYPPSDPRSQRVRDEIKAKFERASKLLVLVGDRTHNSEWVEWEIKTFFSIKHALSGQSTFRRIRGMRLKGSSDAKLPPALANRAMPPLDWDPDALHRWLDENPNG
jgi:hypothetical protein